MKEKLLKEFAPIFDIEITNQIASLEKLCESPIEVMLGVAMRVADKLSPMPWHPLIVVRQGEEEEFYGGSARLLIPQYRWREYRIDWVLKDGDDWVFIECDGHDFHERTKEQAARDRARDREIQQAGIPVLRFTGSEIFRDPVGCAYQVLNFCGDQHMHAALGKAG